MISRMHSGRFSLLDSPVSVFPTPGGPLSRMMTPFPARPSAMHHRSIEAAALFTFAMYEVVKSIVLLRQL